MTNFVYDNVALPAAKTDRYPVTDATRQWAAADSAAVFGALEDIRKVVNGQSFNVLAFGAVGDGVTDDYAAINAAMSAAASTVGGGFGSYVLFPKGTYISGTQIVMPNGVGLIAAVPSGVVIKASPTFNATSLIRNASQDGTQEFGFMSGIFIDGNQAAGALCTTAVVDWGSLFVNSYMRDCIIMYGSNVGLRVSAASTPGGMGPIPFDNCWVANNLGDNVVVEEVASNTGACAGILFRNLTTENQGTNKSALRLTGLGHCTQWNFQNTHIEMGSVATGRTGITIDGVAYCLFDGIQVLGNPATISEGIKITAAIQNVGIQIRSVTNENLINPIIRDLKNTLTVGAVNVPWYVTPEVNIRGGIRFTPDSAVTAKSLVAQDSSGVDRAWFDANGRINGSSLSGAGMDVKADSVNDRALIMLNNAASRAFGFFFPDASNFRLRYFTGGVDLLNFDNAGNTFIYNPTTFQFASTFQSGLINSATTRATNEIVPTILGANQNDYSPTGMSTAAVVLLSSSGSFNITGLATGTIGRQLWLYNNGTNNIVLTNQDVLSVAANRILCRGGANMTLTVNTGAMLYYSPSLLRWVVVTDTL